MPLAPEAKKTDEPIRVLVVQLARMGDTLQSLMALRAAKQLYPNLEITFVARDGFAQAAERSPWIKKVHVLPVQQLMGSLIKHEAKENVVPLMAEWLRPLVQFRWDFVVNWTFSEASSYLTALIPGRVKLGYSRHADLSFACEDGWSCYLQAIVQGHVDQNIHLTDIFTTQLLTALQIHKGDPTGNGNEPVTSKGFFQLKGTKGFESGRRGLGTKWIAVQLGAGSDKKVWPVDYWVELVETILLRHPDYSIVVLGGKADVPRVAEFLNALKKKRADMSRIRSLVNQTDFDLWASAISRCNWLISTNTAAIHLASVHGTRVLNLSIGPVKCAETGPYGNGHYVISPKDGEISPEAVYGTWSYGCSEWSHQRQKQLNEHFEQLGLQEELASVNVQRSRIRPTNEGGGVVFESVTSAKLNLNEWLSIVMGQIARSWYCGWVAPVGQEMERQQVNIELVRSLRGVKRTSTRLLSLLESAEGIAWEIATRSANLRSEKVMNLDDKTLISVLGQRLTKIDQIVERLSDRRPVFKAFSQMSRVMMHNLQSRNLSELGRESAESYRRLRSGLELLQEWLKFTVALARPVAVSSGKVVQFGKKEEPKEIHP